MSRFKLQSTYTPIPDQEQAITSLVNKIKSGEKRLVLRGVTGSGKTFTVANVINRLNMPALIISHNKTLAAQLYQEYRDFFPENAVSYFVSYYDYYQPEAYIPSTDTYIEKDADINEFIDKLRLQATANLVTRNDVLVVASVSCIYNIGSPKDYQKFTVSFAQGNKFNREEFIDRLVNLQYMRGDFGFHRGTFRVIGDTISVYPSYMDQAVEVEFNGDIIKKLATVDVHTGEVIEKLKSFMLFPAKHFIADSTKEEKAIENIKKDLEIQTKKLKDEGHELESYRLRQKVEYDLEMIGEMGYVKGIENYSRYFDGRKTGEAPNTLLTYFQEKFGDNWLVIVDESHITFPQIRGMHAGDLSRKRTLIDYGFRLPSALDNRPLKFDEFMRKIPGFLAASATPSDWERSLSQGNIVEQLLRPTGIPDPKVEVRPISTQVADCIKEAKKRAKRKERCLITTLTKRTAEDLAEYLGDHGLKVHYLHSDIKTLERTDILDDLRRGNYDALVGINLLREGLDLPEVSLVAILDADKEGFLRSETSLIQTMGRAARHVDGKVILYADKITGSMERALGEVRRRRKYQIAKNKEMGITPSSIKKELREKLVSKEQMQAGGKDKREIKQVLPEIEADALTPMDKKQLTKMLKTEMRIAANDLNFELAIEIRDKLRELES